MRLFSRVIAAACLGASPMIISQAGAINRTVLGARFPGSQVTSTEQANSCGERYRFSSNAPLASVAKFYRDQGSSAGLTLLKDTDVGDPSYRMIAFMRPHGHELLFVTLTKTGEAIRGIVYYAPANRQQCS